MITQLLDFTRTRIGSGIPLSPTRSDLATICTSAVDELETARPEAAITVDRRGDTAGTWDQDRLAQVFSNIVGNALDHGVDSAAAIRLDGTAADAVAIEVRNGGAIPADRLSTIFNPFLPTARPDPRAGLGLGLYIADQIVHAHGGSIEASTADATTLFRIVIPRAAPSAAQLFAECRGSFAVARVEDCAPVRAMRGARPRCRPAGRILHGGARAGALRLDASLATGGDHRCLWPARPPLASDQGQAIRKGADP